MSCCIIDMTGCAYVVRLINCCYLYSIFLIAGLKIYTKLTTGICRSKKRMDGKTVIVTGANTGNDQLSICCRYYSLLVWVAQGRSEGVWAPVKTLFRPPPPQQGRLAKNLYSKSERLTFSCRVAWAWSDATEKDKNIYTIVGPRPLVICTSSPPPPSVGTGVPIQLGT
jgi:hypothetical protein